jgi:Uma2 family endonuclease
MLAKPEPPGYRFTVRQYHRMAKYGILNEDDRVELLEGRLVPKMTQNPPHAACVLLTQTKLLAHLREGWVLRIQSSITLSESEPEPDLVVARGPARRYVRRHPAPKDVALVIEVADTTVETDRDWKGRLYAQARIPLYWIVNLNTRVVEDYSRPRAGKSPQYRHRQDFSADTQLALVLDGETLAQLCVHDLLP